MGQRHGRRIGGRAGGLNWHLSVAGSIAQWSNTLHLRVMNWPRADLPLRGLIPLLLLDVNNGRVDSRDLLILHMGHRRCKHRQSNGDTNRMHQGAIYACVVDHPNGPMGMCLSSSNIVCGNIVCGNFMGLDICVGLPDTDHQQCKEGFGFQRWL